MLCFCCFVLNLLFAQFELLPEWKEMQERQRQKIEQWPYCAVRKTIVEKVGNFIGIVIAWSRMCLLSTALQESGWSTIETRPMNLPIYVLFRMHFEHREYFPIYENMDTFIAGGVVIGFIFRMAYWINFCKKNYYSKSVDCCPFVRILTLWPFLNWYLGFSANRSFFWRASVDIFIMY